MQGVQTWINRDSLQFSGDKHMIRETNDIKADLLPPTAVINTPLGNNRSALIGCRIWLSQHIRAINQGGPSLRRTRDDLIIWWHIRCQCWRGCCWNKVKSVGIWFPLHIGFITKLLSHRVIGAIRLEKLSWGEAPLGPILRLHLLAKKVKRRFPAGLTLRLCPCVLYVFRALWKRLRL